MSDTDTVYFDRSRWECDQTCRRKRYWQYQYQRKGVVKAGFGFELGFGGAWHEGARHLHLHGADAIADAIQIAQTYMDSYLGGLTTEKSREAKALLEGLLRGWLRSVAYTKLMSDYDIVDVERELIYTGEPGIKFACRPDLIVRSKSSRQLVYIEFKTTSSVKAGWFKPWKRAPQLLATTLAVQQTYGEPLGYALIQAIYKGYATSEHFESPFVSAWHNPSTNPVQWADRRPASYKGWGKVMSWEIGYPAWLGCLGQDIIDIQFPTSMPIYVAPAMVQNWWQQAIMREREIAAATRTLTTLEEALAERAAFTPEEFAELLHQRNEVLNVTFAQNFTACEPGWMSNGCPCLDLCWIDHIAHAPLTSGYVWRQPHHEAEGATLPLPIGASSQETV